MVSGYVEGIKEVEGGGDDKEDDECIDVLSTLEDLGSPG